MSVDRDSVGNGSEADAATATGRPYGAKRCGVPGVSRVAGRWRVRFIGKDGSRSYGTYETEAQAAEAARAVLAYRGQHGVLPVMADARERSCRSRADSRTGVKGVQAYAGRYRVRFRVAGRLRSFGSFERLEDAKSRAAQVLAARGRGDDLGFWKAGRKARARDERRVSAAKRA